MRGPCTAWAVAHLFPLGRIGFGGWMRTKGCSREANERKLPGLARIPRDHGALVYRARETQLGICVHRRGKPNLAPGMKKSQHIPHRGLSPSGRRTGRLSRDPDS